MWARYPRNLAPAPFVMRERIGCPINPEIGNSYLLSDARPKSCKKRRRRVIDQSICIHLLVYGKLLAASFCNVCFVYITIATTRERSRLGAVDPRWVGPLQNVWGPSHSLFYELPRVYPRDLSAPLISVIHVPHALIKYLHV